MTVRHPHPSGKPIHSRVVKSENGTRVPYNEPLTPGLRRSSQVYAVGFTANLSSEEEETS